MDKEIILKVRVDNAKDAKFVFEEIDKIADLVGVDKIEMEMRNREGLLSMFRGLWGWIKR
ncbi:hypothetical protein KAW18_02170 [candidate division WOR-3 bacterium]|nr:hypothetical protein [candidate division WOR-3 bacterium]